MRLHSDDFEVSDDSETQDRAVPERFFHRHGLKVLGTVMVAAFAAVIAAQVAC